MVLNISLYRIIINKLYLGALLSIFSFSNILMIASVYAEEDIFFNIPTISSESIINLPDGHWVRILADPPGMRWYHEIVTKQPGFRDIQDLAQQNISCSRWWLKPIQYYSYHNFYAIPNQLRGEKQYLLIGASLGTRFEGHAVMGLLEINGNKTDVLTAVGLFNSNDRYGVYASLGPKTSKVMVPDSIFQITNGVVKRKDGGPYIGVTKDELENYRSGHKVLYGGLPKDIAQEILLGCSNITQAIEVTENDALKLKSSLNNYSLNPPIQITSKNSLPEFEDYWRRLIADIVKVIGPLRGFSNPMEFASGYSDLQNHLGLFFSKDRGNQLSLTYKSKRPWLSTIPKLEYTRLQYKEGDQWSGEWNDNQQPTGFGTLKFAASPLIQIGQLNKKQYINSYKGEMKSGVPNGRGQIVFRRSTLTGTFRDGLPHGALIQQDFEGTPEVIGQYKFGLYDGKVATYQRAGRPFLTANYSGGVLSDGPFIEIRLRFRDGEPWIINRGEIKNQKKNIIKSSYVPRITSFENGDILKVDGESATYFWKNGTKLAGQWSIDKWDFIGPCHLLFPGARFSTTCDAISRPKFPHCENGTIYKTDGKTWPATCRNGTIEWTEEQLVRVKKRDLLSRIDREIDRWVDDIDHLGKELFDIPCDQLGLADNCNANAGVCHDSTGRTTLCDLSGPVSQPEPGYNSNNDYSHISDEDLLWVRQQEVHDMIMNSNIHFPKQLGPTPLRLGRQKPEALAFSPFPEGHAVPPTQSGWPRPDIHGHDNFGARRIRKDPRTGKSFFGYHTGMDYYGLPGAVLISPVSGKVVGIVKHKHWSTILIDTGFVTIRLLYTVPKIQVGQVIKQYQMIGSVGDLSKNPKYAGVPNHVHMTILIKGTNLAININGNVSIPLGSRMPNGHIDAATSYLRAAELPPADRFFLLEALNTTEALEDQTPTWFLEKYN